MPTAVRRLSRPDPAPTACFSVQARAEPGVISRVVELFAKRGLVPTRLHAATEGPGELIVDVQMRGMEDDLALYVAACLRQIVGVEAVVTARKGLGPIS